MFYKWKKGTTVIPPIKPSSDEDIGFKQGFHLYMYIYVWIP